MRKPKPSKRNLAGLILVVIVIAAFSFWVLTTPPLLPVAGAKYLEPVGNYCHGNARSGYRTTAGYVTWGFTLWAPTKPVEVGAYRLYKIVVSKVRENVTNPFYRGITARITAMTLESDLERLTHVIERRIFFDGDCLVAETMVAFERTGNHTLTIGISSETVAIMALGHMPLRSDKTSFLLNLTVQS
jgi:hypothetical protein